MDSSPTLETHFSLVSLSNSSLSDLLPFQFCPAEDVPNLGYTHDGSHGDVEIRQTNRGSSFDDLEIQPSRAATKSTIVYQVKRLDKQ